jgi:secretion/DNA translocation related TadE-like protein
VNADDQRGNVSVLLIAAIALAVVLGGGLARAGRAASERARANAAADAAALAAADGLGLGDPEMRACADAGRIAAENDARLVTCRASSTGAFAGSVQVVVAFGAAEGEARAEVDPIGAAIAGPGGGP